MLYIFLWYIVQLSFAWKWIANKSVVRNAALNAVVLIALDAVENVIMCHLYLIHMLKIVAQYARVPVPVPDSACELYKYTRNFDDI